MTRRTPLPSELDPAGFSVSAAREAGLSSGRLRGSDLDAPFHGIRRVATAASATALQLVAAYASRMPEHAFFSHSSAALLFGAPLPRTLESGPPHVSVPAPRKAPRGRGVIGHQLGGTGRRLVRMRSSGIIATHPADTWVLLAAMLPPERLIAVGDYFVTGEEPYSGVAPLTSLDELRDAVDRAEGARGIRAARDALARVRYGALSPQETALRLAMVAGGLPEPVLNHPVLDALGRMIAMIDLAYPGSMTGIEYQGDLHRADPQRYRDDTVRRERLADRGWTMVYATADDLRLRRRETIERIRMRLNTASTSPESRRTGP